MELNRIHQIVASTNQLPHLRMAIGVWSTTLNIVVTEPNHHRITTTPAGEIFRTRTT